MVLTPYYFKADPHTCIIHTDDLLRRIAQHNDPAYHESQYPKPKRSPGYVYPHDEIRAEREKREKAKKNRTLSNYLMDIQQNAEGLV